MRKVAPLLQRELTAYFFSPIAYIALVVFLFFAGYFFSVVLEQSREASLRYVLDLMQFVLLLVTPAISMRLFSEEYRQGTIETLMTDPVRDWEVVLAKFLGGWGFNLFLLLPTLAFVYILKKVGDPDTGPIYSGYIGLALMGAMYISVGMFFSSMTKNQIIAFVTTVVFLLFLYLIQWATRQENAWYASVFKYASTTEHLENFQKGILDGRDVFYYVSATVLFLFLTVRMVESRKWR